MTLDVEAEYKVLGSLNANGIPTISQQKFKARCGWPPASGP